MNNKLLICAKITRKYILGDKDFFIQSFPNLPKKDLEQIWQLGFDAIRHSELIKNVQQINIFQSKIIGDEISKFSNNKYKIHGYLFSRFDPSILDLEDEIFERRLRYELAKIYFQLLRIEIIQENASTLHGNQKQKRASFSFLPLIYFAGFLLFLFSQNIINGFTSAEKLAQKYYERSSYEVRIGAICQDGWKSRATGQGACSHHGGVQNWKYKKIYRRSLIDCKEEALKKSWID